MSFIPKNPFADLTGANPTSIISVVIFAAFLGVAALKLLKDDAPKGERVLTAIDTLQSWVMKLVRLVMQLTPYGVLALMTKVVAGSNLQDIIKLGSFVVASYLGLLIMFAVHGLLLGINGVSPLKYFRKVWPVITFAFTSRSSAACSITGVRFHASISRCRAQTRSRTAKSVSGNCPQMASATSRSVCSATQR